MDIAKIEKAKVGTVIRCNQIPGLYLRVGKRGKTWNFFRYGQPRACLGPYPLHSIEDARNWARELNGGKRERWTLKDVVARITARAQRKGFRQTDYVYQNLQRHAPDWMDKGLEEITRQMVNDRHEKLVASRGPVAGERLITMLRIVYRFADTHLDVTLRCPAKGVETVPQKPRKRVMSADELARFWENVGKEDEYFQSYFTLLYYTGQRRTVTARMEWKEVDLDAGTWTIPAEKAKNKEQHVVQLTEQAVAALRNRLTCTDGRGWVFPSPYDAAKPLSDPYKAWMRVRPADDLTLHDVRRSVGSFLANAGVNLQTVAAILGHKTVATTLKHYTNVNGTAARAALRAL